MPTQRFLNLPAEKRQRITDAIIAELAETGPDGANVAGIVTKADIPRGSFYQYFDDLDDVLDYALSVIVQAKLKYLASVMEFAGKIPFLEFFRRAYAAGLEFAVSNPKFLAISSHMYTSTGERSTKLMDRAMKDGQKYYAQLIEVDKEKGHIRSDVDTMVLARLLMTVASDVVLQQMHRGDKTNTEIMMIVDQMTDIFANGIVGRGGKVDV